MADSRGAAIFFTDEDFVWVDSAFETAPTVPSVVTRPRRRKPPARTLAGDLARLRALFERHMAALPPRARALLAAGVLASILALVLVIVLREGRAPVAPPTKATAPRATKQPVNAPPPTRTLRAGDRAPAVADLQRALAALGFYSETVDGVYGDSTGAAVLAFQSGHGLVADGVAGPLTVQALLETLAAGAESDATTAEEGLAAAAAAGRLSSGSTARYRNALADSLDELQKLPPGRAATLVLVFHDIAAIASNYDEPRALTLFSMLERNASYLAERAPSAEQPDIRDADGVVYRFFPGHGFQFHPIAEFARLNRLAAQEERDAVARLARALVARGVPSGRALLWEYYFPFGGPPSWSSGFAQAAAAQALARSAALLGDKTLEEKARAAFRGIGRGLWLSLGGGVWVREYGYTDMAILNAQLQSLVSLYEYVEITGDESARATTQKMALATNTLLSQFDTGCWSRYSLGGSPASLHYHTYHVRLLKQLAAVTGDPLWSTTAARWQGYLDSGAAC